MNPLLKRGYFSFLYSINKSINDYYFFLHITTLDQLWRFLHSLYQLNLIFKKGNKVKNIFKLCEIKQKLLTLRAILDQTINWTHLCSMPHSLKTFLILFRWKKNLYFQYILNVTTARGNQKGWWLPSGIHSSKNKIENSNFCRHFSYNFYTAPYNLTSIRLDVNNITGV